MSRSLSYMLLALATLMVLDRPAWADTAMGDWGHFFGHRPRMLLNNPDGRAFRVTMHVMQWAHGEWNRPAVTAKLTAPDGVVISDKPLQLAGAEATLDVPAGARGVYTLETQDAILWIESTLDQSVLWTGKTQGHAFDDRRLIAQPSVPRRWWFWVPADVTTFKVKAQRSDRFMSQREDWGVSVFSPRGQRTAVLWGQPLRTPPAEYRQEQAATIEVEPGAAGRFWSFELRLGDSHNHSKPNVCLEGVPPYLARSPEEWFDPQTGCAPPVSPYDDTPFIQSARDEAVLKERWPTLQHFSPCPSLGDADGVMVLGDARFAMWNPQGRPLGFRIGSYLPHKDGERAAVRITGAGDRVLLDKVLPVLHLHHSEGRPTDTLEGVRGVAWAQVTGAPRWMAFTYPATPLVLAGEPIADGWSRFRLTVGTARDWWFRVPRGVKEFSIRAAVDDPDDVLSLEIAAPDRVVAMIFDRAGERTICVPPGLDGKIWRVRPDVGGGTRMITRAQTRPRHLEMNLSLDLRGVPAYLAPTWEQWFDPAKPVAATQRSQ